MGHEVFIRAIQIEISNSNSQLFLVIANWHPREWFLSTQRKNRLRGTRAMPPATGAPFSTPPGRVGISFRSTKAHAVVYNGRIAVPSTAPVCEHFRYPSNAKSPVRLTPSRLVALRRWHETGTASDQPQQHLPRWCHPQPFERSVRPRWMHPKRGVK